MYNPTNSSFQSFLDQLHRGEHHAKGEVIKFSDKDKVEYTAARPFIFFPEQGTKFVDPVENVDLPFKCCYFEMFGDRPITSAMEGDQEIDVWGIAVKEFEPRKYDLLILLAFPKEKHKMSILSLQHEDPTSSNEGFKKMQRHFLGVVQSLLNRFERSSFGTSKSLGKIKVKTKEGKQFIKPHKFIYVAPKSKRDSFVQNNTANIDWSYRWEVRGHWRYIPDRIGKNREGNPIQHYTWIASYVKGPEDKPLIEKVRISR